MSTFLHHLGYFCARFRFVVLGIWVLLAVGLLLCLSTFGAVTNNDLTLPGTGSQDATDLLAAEFPPQQNGGSPIVFHVDRGKLTDAANSTAIQDSVAAIAKVPHVYSAPDPTAQASLMSKDGQTAFSTRAARHRRRRSHARDGRSASSTRPPRRTKAGIEVEAGGPIGSDALADRHREQRGDRSPCRGGHPHASPSAAWSRWACRSSWRSSG